MSVVNVMCTPACLQILYPLRIKSSLGSVDYGVDSVDNGMDSAVSVVLHLEDNAAPLITPSPLSGKRRGGGRGDDGSDIQFQAIESGYKKLQSGFWVMSCYEVKPPIRVKPECP
jgi:hypothetical protein